MNTISFEVARNGIQLVLWNALIVTAALFLLSLVRQVRLGADGYRHPHDLDPEWVEDERKRIFEFRSYAVTTLLVSGIAWLTQYYMSPSTYGSICAVALPAMVISLVVGFILTEFPSFRLS